MAGLSRTLRRRAGAGPGRLGRHACGHPAGVVSHRAGTFAALAGVRVAGVGGDHAGRYSQRFHSHRAAEPPRGRQPVRLRER